MTNELIMNITPGETRLARLEDGAVADLLIERDSEVQVAGNIYKGIITRVLPGMQAAFLDIGLERAAFLYVTDVIPDLFEGMEDEEEEAEGGSAEASGGGEAAPEAASPQPPPQQEGGRDGRGQGRDRDRWRGRGRRRRGPMPKIEDVLKEGQALVVQVAKEPIRTKGARVTCHISLPGRYIVAMPTVNHVGVSRRVGSYERRMKLKELIQKNRPSSQCGYIARTISAQASEENIIADMQNLHRIWTDIWKKQEKTRAPALLYQDLGLVLRTVRDMMSPDIDRLVIDSDEDHRQVMDFMAQFMPELAGRVELYNKETPVFDVFGIETEINRALGKKVWLKSGGYLIIDVSEALTAIDVNTGRFVGRDNFEDTILQTNLEAAEEIAYQLRLRNIGGIIIIDLIDMERYTNRQKVFYALKDTLRRDKVKTTITKISELGLVEMTRKRVRDSLTKQISEACYFCNGKGHVKTPTTVAFEVFRELKRTSHHLNGKGIVVNVHPRVAQVFFNESRQRLDAMEKRFSRRIIIEPTDAFHIEKFEIKTRG